MSRVRGTVVLNTFAFVRKTHGPGAHEKILQALGPADAALLALPPREAAWLPVLPLVAYLEAAKALYAPAEDGYFRTIGRFAGTVDRESRAMGVMVSDLETATKMARVLWRQFYEEGELEVVEQTPAGARLRILGFPAYRAICQRIAGSLEGLLGGAALHVTVDKSACVLSGDPCCEYTLHFAAPGPPGAAF
jgi:hypothetical protein